MAIISCPECRRGISDKADSCPNCGYPLRRNLSPPMAAGYQGYEYKSKATLFGQPLVHIASGMGPMGRMRVAKGIIAIGNVAFGLIAIGGVSIGGLVFGGLGLGLVSFAGMALGLIFGVGGISTGYIAVGGVAVGCYAVGGLCIGAHTIYNDPEIFEKLKSMFNNLRFW